MTEYDITIEGHVSGLTENAIESIVRDAFPDAENIEVQESGESE